MDHKETFLPSFRFNSDHLQLKGWSKIFQTGERQEFHKKSVIVRQGQDVKHLYYIEKGLVEYTYICEDGAQEILEVLGEGNIFGLQPIFGNNPAVGSFIALEDCTLSMITVDQLYKSMDRDPYLAKELLCELSKITGGLIRWINGRTLSANRRIEELIYLLADYRNRKESAQRNIFIPLSQEDLARISRTTRVTVAKTICELKRQKLIETCYGGIVVRDFCGLGNNLSIQNNKTQFTNC